MSISSFRSLILKNFYLRVELEKFLKSKNIPMKTLIAGLSKPFRHLDKYPATLQELERNMEVSFYLKIFNDKQTSVFAVSGKPPR